MRTVGVIGGGIVGLSIAWELAKAGMQVTLFEKDKVGEGTSSVAAGMLAPEAEVDFGEEALMKLGHKSLGLYPSFLRSLKEEVDEVPDLDPCGTVLVAKDRDDAEQLSRLYSFREELGSRVEWWGGSEARERMDFLSPRVGPVIWLAEDAQVDALGLLSALKRALLQKGAEVKEGLEVKAYGKDREAGAWLKDAGGMEHSFDEMVIAAGVHSNFLQGGREDHPTLHPVKGQILQLGPLPGGGPDRMIRSPRVYIVPKSDGSIRVGGTSEEVGFDRIPTAGGVRDLLEEAWELLPAIRDAEFISVEVGLRPAHRDHRARVGRDESGVLYATGHYRHGFLLAPITAQTVRVSLEKGWDPWKAGENELPYLE